MRIQEAAQRVGCTQRAIKFYEEKGLLPHIVRSDNGYRDYTDEDIHILHEIHAYRKLGISVGDIHSLLTNNDKTLLNDILKKKRASVEASQREVAALEAFIAHPDTEKLCESVDFPSLAEAIRTQIPGYWGEYLVSHFSLYLNITITTDEQKDAYKQILAFWDNPGLKLPLLFRINMWIIHLFPTKYPSLEQMDAHLQSMLNPSEEQYAQIKEQTRKTILARKHILMRYLPGEVLKRRMMCRLKDCGYFDIFIKQMKRLSPPYLAYQNALEALNTRLSEDLDLYYDSKYNLLMKR